jgi:hypothetical protein
MIEYKRDSGHLLSSKFRTSVVIDFSLKRGIVLAYHAFHPGREKYVQPEADVQSHHYTW